MLPKVLEMVGSGEPEPVTLLIRLLLAWLCGWLVALVARHRQPTDAPDTQTLTLILLSILISIATQIIGDNVARAFSLVGALSIVRFRTAVPTTREVAFVLAAVVVGMAIGAANTGRCTRHRRCWLGNALLFDTDKATLCDCNDGSRPNLMATDAYGRVARR